MLHIILFTKSKTVANQEHVTILKRHDDDTWIFFDPMATGNIDIRILNNGLVERLCKYNRYIYYNLKEYKSFRTGGIFGLTCVSMVKIYFGIKRFSVITPNELYNYLSHKKITIWQKMLSPFKGFYYYCLFLKR
jgi:hypothetical protein